MSDSEVSKTTIKPNSLCSKCRYELIRGSKYRESDPWMALEITSLLTLINIALKKNKFLVMYGEDIEGINKIKCLGCYLPEEMKSIIKIAKETRDIEKIKSFGENFSEKI